MKRINHRNFNFLYWPFFNFLIKELLVYYLFMLIFLLIGYLYFVTKLVSFKYIFDNFERLIFFILIVILIGFLVLFNTILLIKLKTYVEVKVGFMIIMFLFIIKFEYSVILIKFILKHQLLIQIQYYIFLSHLISLLVLIVSFLIDRLTH